MIKPPRKLTSLHSPYCTSTRCFYSCFRQKGAKLWVQRGPHGKTLGATGTLQNADGQHQRLRWARRLQHSRQKLVGRSWFCKVRQGFAKDWFRRRMCGKGSTASKSKLPNRLHVSVVHTYYCCCSGKHPRLTRSSRHPVFQGPCDYDPKLEPRYHLEMPGSAPFLSGVPKGDKRRQPSPGPGQYVSFSPLGANTSAGNVPNFASSTQRGAWLRSDQVGCFWHATISAVKCACRDFGPNTAVAALVRDEKT